MIQDGVLDYEYLGYCEYGVYDAHDNIRDCNEPAVAKVWLRRDGVDIVLVCSEHLQTVLKEEAE